MKLTSVKTIILGSKVKFLYFDTPISYDFENIAAQQRKSGKEIITIGDDRGDSMELSALKARSRLRNLVWCNAWQYKKANGSLFVPQFSTFTFDRDVVDFATGHPLYNNFIKRLNYQFDEKVLCITVPEFQKDTDYHGKVKELGGRVHYHAVFFNLPYLKNPHAFLSDTWGNGYVFSKSINSVQHLSRYVTKYVQKDLENKHIKFKKRYLVSRGIKRPVEIYDQQFAVDFERYISAPGIHTTRENDYDSTDGRKIHELELTFPDGFDLSSLVGETPQDTLRLAQQMGITP